MGCPKTALAATGYAVTTSLLLAVCCLTAGAALIMLSRGGRAAARRLSSIVAVVLLLTLLGSSGCTAQAAAAVRCGGPSAIQQHPTPSVIGSQIVDAPQPSTAASPRAPSSSLSTAVTDEPTPRSTSSPSPTTLDTDHPGQGAYGDDPQTIQVTVPAGSLVISTPYTATNPCQLGELRLDNSGSMLSTSTRFGDGTVAGSIMITDTRPGGVGWNASVQASDFAGPDGAAINAANLGLDDLATIAVPGNGLAPADLELINRPGAAVPLAAGEVSPAGLAHQPHTFATATGGHIGTIGITGRLALVAPTSAEPGLYTATLTFTVV